jgi:hypothetical protein
VSLLEALLHRLRRALSLPGRRGMGGCALSFHETLSAPRSPRLRCSYCSWTSRRAAPRSKGSSSRTESSYATCRWSLLTSGSCGEGSSPDAWSADVPKRLELVYFWSIAGKAFGRTGRRSSRATYLRRRWLGSTRGSTASRASTRCSGRRSPLAHLRSGRGLGAHLERQGPRNFGRRRLRGGILRDLARARADECTAARPAARPPVRRAQLPAIRSLILPISQPMPGTRP